MAHPRQPGRITSLDGLRAISIVLVLASHLDGTGGYPAQGVRALLGDFGHLGVQIFFVISGFLITLLLMQEQRSGGIALGRFYLRRALRLAPAFIAFLLAMMIATSLSWAHLTLVDIVAAATYTVNYLPHRAWEIGHLWSLSVEEQFYLIWPLALLRISARKRLMALALVMFLAAPVLRAAMRLTIVDPDLRDLEVFPAVADAISIGCLMALGRERLLRWPAYRALTGSWTLWLTLPFIAVINRYNGFVLIDLLGAPLALIMLAVIIEACTRLEHGPLDTLLNCQPVVFVGVLSYSLYLWQQPFLNRHSAAAACQFPVNLALVVLVALVSYFLIEKPLLALRHRWAVAPRVAAIP